MDVRTRTMQAITQRAYGSSEVLTSHDVAVGRCRRPTRC